MLKIIFFSMLFCLPVSSLALEPAEFIDPLAKRYGVAVFEKVDSIDFTFNVKIGDKNISRKWSWWPRSDAVALTQADKTIRFNRKDDLSASPEAQQADKWFINDSYWLLFPHYLKWDFKGKIQNTGGANAPISGELLRRFVITYDSESGYTPGDVYELFVDADYIIHEWIFRKGGGPKPSRITRWKNMTTQHGITMALLQESSDGSFKIEFTDVTISLR